MGASEDVFISTYNWTTTTVFRHFLVVRRKPNQALLSFLWDVALLSLQLA